MYLHVSPHVMFTIMQSLILHSSMPADNPPASTSGQNRSHGSHARARQGRPTAKITAEYQLARLFHIAFVKWLASAVSPEALAGNQSPFRPGNNTWTAPIKNNCMYPTGSIPDTRDRTYSSYPKELHTTVYFSSRCYRIGHQCVEEWQ